MEISKCSVINDAYISPVFILFFWGYKRTTNRESKQNFNRNFRENAVEAIKSYFAPRFLLHPLRMLIMRYAISHYCDYVVKLDKKEAKWLN